MWLRDGFLLTYFWQVDGSKHMNSCTVTVHGTNVQSGGGINTVCGSHVAIWLELLTCVKIKCKKCV